jgi:hypothetical protein
MAVWPLAYPNIGIQSNQAVYGAQAMISTLIQPLTPNQPDGWVAQRVGVAGPPLPPPLGDSWWEVGWRLNADGSSYALTSRQNPIDGNPIEKQLTGISLGGSGSMHTYEVGRIDSTSWGAWIDGVQVDQYALGWGDAAPQFAIAGGEARYGNEPMGDANGDFVAYANCVVLLPTNAWAPFPSPSIYNNQPTAVWALTAPGGNLALQFNLSGTGIYVVNVCGDDEVTTILQGAATAYQQTYGDVMVNVTCPPGTSAPNGTAPSAGSSGAARIAPLPMRRVSRRDFLRAP